MTLSPAELHLLIHACTGGSDHAYRNYYCAAYDSEADHVAMGLVDKGLLSKHKQLQGQLEYYSVTDAGLEIVEANLGKKVL